MNIEFYVPKNETIPTKLRVKVDETIDVYYERLPDAFGFKFDFFKHQAVSMEMASAITDKIVSKMISQSYDHGSRWVECGEREVYEDEWDLYIKVFFRVRDAG